jgi:hypothetical protein
VTDDVVCEATLNDDGAGGAVVATIVVNSPSPDALKAATLNVYDVPPTSPVIDADVAFDPAPPFNSRESYAVIVTGPFSVPSLRYTT